MSTSAHGWRDVGFTLAGGGIGPAQSIRVRFDGRRYPNDPRPVLRHGPAGKVLIGD
jgi:hypothetical protein